MILNFTAITSEQTKPMISFYPFVAVQYDITGIVLMHKSVPAEYYVV